MNCARTSTLCLGLFVFGCTDPSMQDPPDAGRAPTDAGTTRVDAGSDAGLSTDAGRDAGLDAGLVMDAGADAGMDAGLDAGVDAGHFPIDTAPGAEIRGRPSISFDGADFLVVRRDTLVTPYAFRAGRITTTGASLDPGGVQVATTNTTGYGAFPGVAFDGANHLVVWAEANGDVLGVRVSRTAMVVDATPLVLGSGSKIRPVSIAFNGTSYLIAWRSLIDEIKVTRISPAGVVLDSLSGTVVGSGFYPWVATDGQDFIVIWHTNGNGLDVKANRVSAAGMVLDGQGFFVTQDPQDQDHASVAFNGTNYLVVWHDTQGGDVGNNDGTARGARVSPAGMVLDTPTLIGDLCRGQWPVTVAASGADFMVTWQTDNETISQPRLVDVYARRVGANGQPMGSTLPVTEAAGHQWGPVIGSGNSLYLISWSEGGASQGTVNSGVWGKFFPAQ